MSFALFILSVRVVVLLLLKLTLQQWCSTHQTEPSTLGGSLSDMVPWCGAQAFIHVSVSPSSPRAWTTKGLTLSSLSKLQQHLFPCEPPSTLPKLESCRQACNAVPFPSSQYKISCPRRNSDVVLSSNQLPIPGKGVQVTQCLTKSVSELEFISNDSEALNDRMRRTRWKKYLRCLHAQGPTKGTLHLLS